MSPCTCGTCFDCRFRDAKLADVDRGFLALVEARAATGELQDEGQRWLAAFVRNLSENVRLGFLRFEMRDEDHAVELAEWCTARAKEVDARGPAVIYNPRLGLMDHLLSEPGPKWPREFIEIHFSKAEPGAVSG